MTIQQTINNLNRIQKEQTKNINFQQGNNNPSFSGDALTIYDYDATSQQLRGDLDLTQFPNLRKITFTYNFRINLLENINVSDTNLSRIIVGQNSQSNTLDNAYCNLL